MTKVLTITFMILITTALAFSPEPASDVNPGCIVMPEVIEACENSGGRFDYQLCSCVGGSGQG